MTKSSSEVGNLLSGQISHHKIYYGQIVLLSYRKANSKTVRLYARPKFPKILKNKKKYIKKFGCINKLKRIRKKNKI
jgi:hypothetical protein